jgi:hypothetical protein
MGPGQPQAVLQFDENAALMQAARGQIPSLVANPLGIRDDSGRMGGCSTWARVAAHLERDCYSHILGDAISMSSVHAWLTLDQIGYLA